MDIRIGERTYDPNLKVVGRLFRGNYMVPIKVFVKVLY